MKDYSLLWYLYWCSERQEAWCAAGGHRIRHNLVTKQQQRWYGSAGDQNNQLFMGLASRSDALPYDDTELIFKALSKDRQDEKTGAMKNLVFTWERTERTFQIPLKSL